MLPLNSTESVPTAGSLMENLQPFSKPGSSLELMLLGRCGSTGKPILWAAEVEPGKLEVQTATKFLVVPTRPTASHWLPLSNLDRVVNPTFVSVIFFYENVLGLRRSFSTLTSSLRESLSKVLAHFYPLAGRLAARKDGVVDIHCNDAGAIFIEASINAELAELGGPQPMPMLSGMEAARLGPGPRYLPTQTESMPTLVIQVTAFTCGSVAVAANWHHTVADGFSGCHFMRSWAEVLTGQELSLQPCHNRHLLRPRNLTNPSKVIGYSIQKLDEGSRNRIRPIVQGGEDVMVKPFFLCKQSVQRVKSKANTDVETNDRQFTSTESISAQLWKVMTRARAQDEQDRMETSRFYMFVDGRKRLGLPPGYFGNVVCSACAKSTQEELLQNPSSYAAKLIQKAIKGVDKNYFRSLIDWVEVQGSAASPASEHARSTGYDVAATFWTFFPLYEINFGWGKPVLSVRNAPPRNLIDGISMMPSQKGSGNMVAVLNLHADRMHKLEQDPEFNMLFRHHSRAGG